jgi:hypothetical protein
MEQLLQHEIKATETYCTISKQTATTTTEQLNMRLKQLKHTAPSQKSSTTAILG